MNAPPRPCPRCGALVTSPCRACLRRAGRDRPTSTTRGYGGAWRDVSRRFLAAFPWCGQRQDGRRHDEHSQCTRQNERRRAQVVDHIVPLSVGGARLDPVNLQSLCTSCNTSKSYADARRAAATTGSAGRGHVQGPHAPADFGDRGADSIATSGEHRNRMRSPVRVRNL